MRHRRLSSFAVATALLVVGCQPTLRAARSGDFAEARTRLEQAPIHEPAELERLAVATLSYDIERAEGHPGRVFVASLRACARELTPALRRRAKKEDAIGAEAGLLLLGIDRYRGRAPREFAHDPDGAWRALAARAEKDQVRRVRYLTDDDERVRSAALEAAFAAQDERDLEAMLEVSRLDPSPHLRSRAIAWLGQLGGKRAYRALLDRLPRAETTLALGIVDALSRPGVFEVGGEAALGRLMHERSDVVGLHAAYLLSRSGEAAQPPSTWVGPARTRLVHFAEQGTEEERRMALRLLPLEDARTDDLLVRSSGAPDRNVALIAWARLLGRPRYERSATAELEKIAQGNDRLAHEARAALAAGGKRVVLPLLQKQARELQPELRLVAGRGLLRLEAYEDLAPLLLDASEEVRSPLACQVLAHRD